MRKFLLAATALSMLLAFTPSQAASKTITKKAITFRAATPCTAICAYQTGPLSDDVAATAGVGNPIGGKFDACGAPFPAGSWADVVVTAPRLANTLVFRIFPAVDWDSFICTKPARGKSRQLATGANSVDPTCLYGCEEEVSIRVRPGTKYILRAFNFSDPYVLPADYRFLRIS